MVDVVKGGNGNGNSEPVEPFRHAQRGQSVSNGDTVLLSHRAIEMLFSVHGSDSHRRTCLVQSVTQPTFSTTRAI
jgi:hypothetical protein